MIKHLRDSKHLRGTIVGLGVLSLALMGCDDDNGNGDGLDDPIEEEDPAEGEEDEGEDM